MHANTLFSIAAVVLVFAAPSVWADGGDPERTKQLVAVLTSDADFYSKARACQQAGEFGTAAAVPALAALLGDEKLSAYARSGLENIPDPSAAAALRAALDTLNGDLLIGVVQSLGALRDEQAEGALQKLAADPARGAVQAALSALGRIASPGAVETIRQALRAGPAALRPDAASACLLAAERQLQLGHADVAKALYDEVRCAPDMPPTFRTGATRGAILVRRGEGAAFLVERLKSPDADVRKGALLAAREFPAAGLAATLCTAQDAATDDGRALLQEALLALYFKPLFNGKTFDGWEGDTTNTFRIADDAVVGGRLDAPVPHNAFLATTRAYTNFILRAECKLTGPTCNAGIQIRSQRIPNHYEMIGYQADMSMGKDGGYWGKLYDESRRKRVLSKDENRGPLVERLKADGWNQYEIRCEGPRIRLFVDGVSTADYTETDASIPLFGLIAVQIHGGQPGEAAYRNLTIAELP